jgi:hypothetical protein
MLKAWALSGGIWWLLSACLAGVAYPFLSQSVFSDDDGHILQLAADAPWLAAYLDPQVYQQLSVAHYTPVVLTVYRSMLAFWGLNPVAFVVMQLTLWGACTALAAMWCHRQTRQTSAGGLMVLLVVGASSFWPMLGRFYTVHYLLGCVFSLWLLLALQKSSALPDAPPMQGREKHQEIKAKGSDSPLYLAGMAVLGLAAVLSKEVYLLLLPTLVVSCLWQRQWARAWVLGLALLIYLAMRWHVLGFSLEGREGRGFVSDVLSIDAPTWMSFFKWYAVHHVLLLSLLAVALWRSPWIMLKWGGLAGLLALPVLAAPHAIRLPEVHADRLFFAFDLALMGAVALALHHRPWKMLRWRWLSLPVLLGAGWLGQAALAKVAQKTAADAQQRITRQILAAPYDRLLTVLTDVNYQQGGLMRVMRLQGAQGFSITQNCHLALANLRLGQTLWVLDDMGNRLAPSLLQERCLPWSQQWPPVRAVTEPSFVDGILSWQLLADEGVQVGVQFPDRGLSLAIGQMRQRMVRPRHNEPYRLFAHRQGQWWFSELRTMQLDAGQP